MQSEQAVKFADEVQIDVLDLSEIDPEVLSAFSCGTEGLDQFLQERAQNDSAKTFLFVDVDRNRIVAYTSLSCSAIMYAVEDDDAIMFAPERFSLVPAIEIKYFAVDKTYQHLRYEDDAPNSRLTLSCHLFRYIVDHIRDIAQNQVGAEYIVLYSVPKAIHFYERNLFNRFKGEMVGNADPYLMGCQPMYMEI